MEDRNNMRTLRKTLVPEVCTDPYEALQYFTLSFEQRYGAMHPLFLLGSLSEAVSEATIGTASSGTVSIHIIFTSLCCWWHCISGFRYVEFFLWGGGWVGEDLGSRKTKSMRLKLSIKIPNKTTKKDYTYQHNYN